MKINSLLKFSIPLLLFISSCSSSDEKYISEGIIEYDAVVVDQNSPMASVAPDKMTIKFKDNKSIAELTAGFGLFSTSFIANPENLTTIQLVKLFNKKFAHITDSNAIKEEKTASPKTKITTTKETKIIAGYKCKKAIISFEDKEQPTYSLYYTDEINIKDPNWNVSPYYELKGMLMEYQVKRYGLEMKFTAKSVTKASIEDDLFELPKDYKLISQNEMDQLFQGFQ